MAKGEYIAELITAYTDRAMSENAQVTGRDTNVVAAGIASDLGRTLASVKDANGLERLRLPAVALTVSQARIRVALESHTTPADPRTLALGQFMGMYWMQTGYENGLESQAELKARGPIRNAALLFIVRNGTVHLDAIDSHLRGLATEGVLDSWQFHEKEPTPLALAELERRGEVARVAAPEPTPEGRERRVFFMALPPAAEQVY